MTTKFDLASDLATKFLDDIHTMVGHVMTTAQAIGVEPHSMLAFVIQVLKYELTRTQAVFDAAQEVGYKIPPEYDKLIDAMMSNLYEHEKTRASNIFADMENDEP